MPRNAVVGDIFEIRWVSACFLQTINLVHHYRIRTVAADVPWTDVVEALRKNLTVQLAGAGNVETPYRACLPEQVFFSHVDMQLVWPIRLAKQSFTMTGSGTHENSTETANQAAVITFRSEDTGRDKVANYHIGPIPQAIAAQDEGYVAASYKENLTDLADGMFQTVTDAPNSLIMDPIIYHRDETLMDLSYDVFFSYVVQETVRTMRRRTVGIGS